MKTWKDWTEEKFENFVYYIAADFVDKLEEEMEESGLTKKELAKRLDVSAGRVSQIFHNPGNLTLEMIVRCARAVGIKVAVLAYNDGDKDNLNGPIVPQVFYECWEKCGKPKNMFEIDEDVTLEGDSVTIRGLHNITIDASKAGRTPVKKKAKKKMKAKKSVAKRKQVAIEKPKR